MLLPFNLKSMLVPIQILSGTSSRIFDGLIKNDRVHIIHIKTSGTSRIAAGEHYIFKKGDVAPFKHIPIEIMQSCVALVIALYASGKSIGCINVSELGKQVDILEIPECGGDLEIGIGVGII